MRDSSGPFARHASHYLDQLKLATDSYLKGGFELEGISIFKVFFVRSCNRQPSDVTENS